MKDVEANKNHVTPIVEKRSFWIKVAVVVIIFLGWRYLAHNSFCKTEVSLDTNIFDGSTDEYYSYWSPDDQKLKFDTYKDAVSSCRANWGHYLFSGHGK